MGQLIPLRPFVAALKQADRAGHPEWRQHCIVSVLDELNAGRSGHAVASELLSLRQQMAALRGPSGDVA